MTAATSAYQPMLAQLAGIWQVAGLAERIRIVPSSRMTRTLARAFPTTGLIRISSHVLASGAEDLIREIVTHEAAHVACRMRLGRRKVRPHGAEWAALMRLAGYPPRARMDVKDVPALGGAFTPRRRPLRYEHHCPACGWTRHARTTNRRWRCAACVRAGRKGLLVTKRLGSGLAG